MHAAAWLHPEVVCCMSACCLIAIGSCHWATYAGYEPLLPMPFCAVCSVRVLPCVGHISESQHMQLGDMGTLTKKY